MQLGGVGARQFPSDLVDAFGINGIRLAHRAGYHGQVCKLHDASGEPGAELLNAADGTGGEDGILASKAAGDPIQELAGLFDFPAWELDLQFGLID